MGEKVAILGASDKTDRYSYKAFQLLKQKGHEVFPVHPNMDKLEGERVYSSLSQLKDLDIDTITVYVNPSISSKLISEFLLVHPNRVIFNPGSENPQLAQVLKESDIFWENACTLILLNTGQY